MEAQALQVVRAAPDMVTFWNLMFFLSIAYNGLNFGQTIQRNDIMGKVEEWKRIALTILLGCITIWSYVEIKLLMP